MSTQEISIDRIVHGATQCRAFLRDDIVEEYRPLAKKGQLPPIVVFSDGSSYYLGDGHYRREAHVREGLSVIKADVRQGGLRQAMLHAAGANSEHGLPRTREDKHRAVQMLLDDDDWGQASDNWIAEQCKVSDGLVARIRAANSSTSAKRNTEGNGESGGEESSGSTNGTSENQGGAKGKKRTGRDGKRYGGTKPPLLCERCKRAGAVANCAACAELRRTKGKPKSGAPIIGMTEIAAITGQYLKAIDNLAHNAGLKKGNKPWEADSVIETPDTIGFRRILEELKDSVKKWLKKIKHPKANEE